jgi:hypothetical protein
MFKKSFFTEGKNLIFIAVFTIACLLFVSSDSYLHPLLNHYDSAIFFMLGKSWMNGMIPYQDFLDSKGPLLMLIYGIGYLLSNYNYIGVFWIYCVWYIAIFYIMFKIAFFFLKDKKKAILCSILSAIPYFSPYFHYETRGENWCHLFISLSLYQTIILLYTKEDLQKKKVASAFIIEGICLGASLLIKFNIGVMMGVFILYSLWSRYKKGIKEVMHNIGWAFVGFLIIALPFIIYMFITDSFDDFIYGYFVATSQTMDSPSITFHIWLNAWLTHISYAERVLPFIILLMGCMLWSKKMENFKYFPLVLFLSFLFLSTIHFLAYYLRVLQPFFIFPIVVFFLYVPRVQLTKFKLFMTSCLTFIYVVIAYSFGMHGGENTFTQNLLGHLEEEKEEFYTVEYLISQVKKPTIISVGYTYMGIGIASNVLPGCHDFTRQTGATQEMKLNQRDAILAKQSDFLVIKYPLDDLKEELGLDSIDLKKLGYKKYYEWDIDSKGFTYGLFSKHQLRPLESPIKIGRFEIFKKDLHERLNQMK